MLRTRFKYVNFSAFLVVILKLYFCSVVSRYQRMCSKIGLISARPHVKRARTYHCRGWLKTVEKRHNPIITKLTPTVVLQMTGSYLCIGGKTERKFGLTWNSSLLWRPFVYESHFACFNVVNQSSQSDQFCSITAPYEVCRKRSGRPDINYPDGEVITFRTDIYYAPCYPPLGIMQW